MSAEADQEARNEYIPSGKIDDSDITVAKDEAPVEEGINTATEDSDEQLRESTFKAYSHFLPRAPWKIWPRSND